MVWDTYFLVSYQSCELCLSYWFVFVCMIADTADMHLHPWPLILSLSVRSFSAINVVSERDMIPFRTAGQKILL